MKQSSSSTLASNASLTISGLYDEKTFYTAFINDLEACREEVIIESPYIPSSRTRKFYSIFKKLLSRGVKIYILTKTLEDQDMNIRQQAETEINNFEQMGIQAFLCTGNHHRKLAILDRKILWEGSLNILSQTHSREIMRRIESKELTMQMFEFLKFERFL